MEEKTVTSLFEEMKNDVANFVVNTIEIGKLEGYEKISKASATISFLIILLFFVFLCLGLAFFTLGFYLSEVFDSFWKGFGATTGGLLLIVVILVLIKTSVKKAITNSVISFLLRKEDDDVDFSNKK